MELRVIGAGFGRTGTMSLKVALEQLGLGPCYHMMEVFSHPDHSEKWTKLAKGEVTDWSPILSGYTSVVDWPTTYFYRQFAEAYPKAKVILTERDPKVWYKSTSSTIFPQVKNNLSGQTTDPLRLAQAEMANYIVFEKTFGGDLGEENAIAVYKRHNESVRHVIPKDRLLVYSGEQGWGPLCAFLGVPVPSTPYPKTNTTEEFQARTAQRAAASHQR